jgi:hypothetical protein
MNIKNYTESLKRMDWEYEFSDDHRVYCNGREELKALVMDRDRLDPAGTIWNQYAPEKFQYKQGVSHA